MIPMLVGARFVRRRPGPRRAKVWVSADSTALIALPPSTVAVQTLTTEAVLESQGKPTIARIRGTWVATHDHSAASATSSLYVAMGITVVSTKSVTAGVASLPTPITNSEWPWMFWDMYKVGTETVTAVGFQQTNSLDNRTVDCKAMRKVPPASTLVAVFETGPALEGAPDVNATLAVRILLLPS